MKYDNRRKTLEVFKENIVVAIQSISLTNILDLIGSPKNIFAWIASCLELSLFLQKSCCRNKKIALGNELVIRPLTQIMDN